MNSQQLENWADQLLAEYEEGRTELNHHRDSLHEINRELIGDKKWKEIDEETKSQITMNQNDKSKINSMISDMSFSMEWMKIGRRPGNMRGIDRRSAYQRRALIDMDLFPSLDIEPEERALHEDEKQAIVNILVDLSHRERQCYLLHMANGLSLAEIGKELNITKRTAQQYVDRAKKKIEGRMEKVS